MRIDVVLLGALTGSRWPPGGEHCANVVAITGGLHAFRFGMFYDKQNPVAGDVLYLHRSWRCAARARASSGFSLDSRTQVVKAPCIAPFGAVYSQSTMAA